MSPVFSAHFKVYNLCAEKDYAPLNFTGLADLFGLVLVVFMYL